MPAEVLPHSRRIMPSGPLTAASLLRLYPGLWAGLAHDWPHTRLPILTGWPHYRAAHWGDKELLPCIYPAVLQHV